MTKIKAEQIREEMRDLGIQEIPIQQVVIEQPKKVLVVKPKNIKNRKEEGPPPETEEEAALKAQIKQVEDKIADIRRWQSSKKNMLENRVRDNYKILEVLIPQYHELAGMVSQKTEINQQRLGVLNKVKDKIEKGKTAG